MDLVGIGFILLFGVVGAAVAYGADWLGRTLGKKRLSIGRLRPRHTAALLTTTAGFLIPILTVMLVALLSSDVRVWLTQGRRAIAENQRLIKRMADDRKKFEAELADLNRQRADLAKQTVALRESYRSLQTRLKEQNQQIAAAKTTLAGEQEKLAQAQKQREEAQSRLASLESKYKDLNSSYAKLESDYQKQIQNLNDNVYAINQDLSEKEKRLAETRSELDTANKQFDLARETFEKDILKAREELDTYRQARDDAQAAMETLKGEKEQIELALSNLRQLQLAQEQGLDKNLRITRTHGLIFRGGEELARIQLGPRQTDEGARAAMNSLLRSARLAAEKRGSTANGSGIAADLVDLPMERGVVTAQEQFDALARAVMDRDEDTVLIAYAFWNGFQGEFLPLRVEAFKNPVVFTRGQRISETRVDGTQGEDNILNQINEFLRSALGQDAIKSGMIPAVWSEKPLGDITSDDILTLVKEIKESRRTIRLLAMASQDLRAADPLKVEFRLR